MKTLLLTTVALLGFTVPYAAQGATILTFGQSGGANTLTATNDASGTSFNDSGIAVSISQIDAALAAPLPAFLRISAASEAPGAAPVGNAIVEHFTGGFAITKNADGSGTNYLSGVFNDAAITATGSTSIGVFASQAAFTSDVITALDLPRSVAFALTNVTPAVSLAACGGCGSGETLAGFDASIAGNASASAPEPSGLAVLGVGLVGLGWIVSRRRNVSSLPA